MVQYWICVTVRHLGVPTGYIGVIYRAHKCFSMKASRLKSFTNLLAYLSSFQVRQQSHIEMITNI